jgi:hypothetical protein
MVPSTATALVIAGLLSVVIYPPVALRILPAGTGGAAPRPKPAAPDPAPAQDPA